jgi:hypothetical protein
MIKKLPLYHYRNNSYRIHRGKLTTDVFLYDKNGVEIICFVLIDGRQTKERMLEEKKFLLPMALYKVP